MAAPVPPGRLRRRLTVAFTLVAGLAALALAAGSYVVVRDARLADSVDRGLEQARFNLVFAGEVLRGRTSEQATDELLGALERRGEFVTVGAAGSRTFSSSLSVGIEQVPADLRTLVARGDLAYRRAEIAGEPALIVGGRAAGAPVELFFVFSEEELFAELRQLLTVLGAGVLLLALAAGLVGAALARRTLAPVGRASDAARSLAEGLLETRLPVEREDEFGAWAASFNEMAEALQTKIAALAAAQERERRFTSNVAHELRTPLTALVGEAGLLAEHLDRMPPEARRPAELLVADVARLRRLVDDLLEISRLDAGVEDVRAEPFNLGALVRACLRAHGWEGRVRVDDGGVPVVSDPRRAERVITNLVGNALEHGGGTVAVRVAATGSDALVEVADRGGGIPPELLPRLFERFAKGDPARAGGGTGLGLAIAREHARLLGGDVQAESEVGAGSRFTLRIPVTRPLPNGEGGVAPGAEDEGVHPTRRRTP